MSLTIIRPWCYFESTSYAGVSEAIVDSSEVENDDGWSEQGVRWKSDHGPDVDQHQRPPLEYEDGHKDGHHPGGGPVSSGVHVDQLGRLSDLDDDQFVGKGDDAEEEDLDDADQFGIHQTSSSSHVVTTPGMVYNYTRVIGNHWPIGIFAECLKILLSLLYKLATPAAENRHCRHVGAGNAYMLARAGFVPAG